jgi:hypothetical protein
MSFLKLPNFVRQVAVLIGIFASGAGPAGGQLVIFAKQDLVDYTEQIPSSASRMGGRRSLTAW